MFLPLTTSFTQKLFSSHLPLSQFPLCTLCTFWYLFLLLPTPHSFYAFYAFYAFHSFHSFVHYSFHLPLVCLCIEWVTIFMVYSFFDFFCTRETFKEFSWRPRQFFNMLHWWYLKNLFPCLWVNWFFNKGRIYRAGEVYYCTLQEATQNTLLWPVFRPDLLR